MSENPASKATDEAKAYLDQCRERYGDGHDETEHAWSLYSDAYEREFMTERGIWPPKER